MTDTPVACSLDGGELEQRLDVIAKVGADSLISHTEGDRHLLRFRANATTRQQLEGIIAAETKCCAFFELSLNEEGNELVLSIGAPKDAQALADELARAFSREVAA